MFKKIKEFSRLLSSIRKSVIQAVAENEDYREFRNRHKIFFNFFRKRLDKSSFTGLTLTLSSIALIYVLLHLGGTVEDIIHSEITVMTDMRVVNLLTIFRTREAAEFFYKITLLGKWQTVAVISAAFITIQWLWRKRSFILPFFISVAGSSTFTALGKIAIRRPRPAGALYILNSYSFPSGHASIAIALYGFLVYFLIKNLKQSKYKTIALLSGGLLILLIGFSRLYLAVHYLSDVWGGYLEGGIWLIISIGMSEYFLTVNNSRSIVHPRRILKYATAAVIALTCLFYVNFAFRNRIPQQPVSAAENLIKTDNLSAIFKDEHLKYAETLTGARQEPLSFIVVARNDEQLVGLFKQADWDRAENISMKSLLRSAKTALLKEPYPHAPITPDFWNTRVHDFGFEKATSANNVRTRHHARFWRTDFTTDSGYAIYVGAASFDSGVKWGITHKIDPNIDAEREFLFKDMQQTGSLSSFTKEQFVKPQLGKNFTGDLFFTDGKLYTVFLSIPD